MASIFVDIPVDGDWPSAADMEARNAVIDALDEQKIGVFVGAGGGMGAMDFSYNVSDADAAKKIIEELLTKHLPNREYTLDVSDTDDE